ncbi:hypothetical protein PUW79_10045 [Microbacterium sp. NE2HP2]|uniref:ATP synthase protein I n=1 Tax=Microbacterium plantarum TaxID=1816425 RepID=A0ABV5EUX8_9MICO|nr:MULTISPECIES: hypothetical protein [Microbacterium]MCZ4068035.1 hypothetical protein [Microbacterium sp. H37-C3]MDD7944968.1 hypothetical protein [Microbacterium plantarum]RAZ31525.1 hypothetical protein DO944_11370 [Microbacterium sp. SMR1]WHE35365.1 hypothetical protein P6897_11765 [Microbacterium sp. BDGP8]WRK16462.1 hypothetical protein VC184_11140 [Microbacterium plantarum]
MNQKTLSSTPILRAALTWGLIVGAVVAVVAAVAGAVVAGPEGAWSGVIGAAVGVIFPALTALSILIANRWYGQDTFLPIYFGIVMGGWVVKFALVLVALLVISRIEWIVSPMFFFALVAAAIGAITVDLVVMARMRLPHVSDTTLPETNPEV